MTDSRLRAPAVARNRDLILDVLRRVLPSSGLVLEIASGSGEHAAHFAAALPDLVFQPSDPDPTARASIDAWSASSGLENIRPALALDSSRAHWPLARADAILCINMTHISPFSATEGLFRNAAEILPSGAVLYLYRPIFARASRPRRAISPSTPGCGRTIRNGACATSAPSRRWRAKADSWRRKSSKCRQIM